MSKYDVTPVDGVLNYGPAHQQRQNDAQAALAELNDLDASVVLSIRDGDKRVARVHRTGREDELRFVIWLKPARKFTPDLDAVNKELQRQGDARIHHLGVATVDPLDAPDDRDLEVSTRSGLVRLDRQKVLERIGFGQTSASLEEVRHD